MSKLVVTNIETQNIKFDSDTTAMTIDSTGRVLQATKPAFFAIGGTNDWNDNLSVGTVLVLDHTKHNVGNHYSTSTGKFTAPVTGVYAFQFGAYIKNASGTGLITARLNDVNIHYTNAAYPAVQVLTQDADTNDEKGKQEEQVSRQTHYTKGMVARLLALEKAKGETW